MVKTIIKIPLNKEWKGVAFIRQGSSAKMPTLKEWDNWSREYFSNINLFF